MNYYYFHKILNKLRLIGSVCAIFIKRAIQTFSPTILQTLMLEKRNHMNRPEKIYTMTIISQKYFDKKKRKDSVACDFLALKHDYTEKNLEPKLDNFATHYYYDNHVNTSLKLKIHGRSTLYIPYFILYISVISYRRDKPLAFRYDGRGLKTKTM